MAAAVRAQKVWADAGLQQRLKALQLAGKWLGERKSELHEGLFADYLSQALANYYGDWIVKCGDPALLERYAKDHAQWIDTGEGGELMVRRADGVVLLVPPANSPTINAATLFSMLLPGNAVICRAPNNDQGLRFIADTLIRPAMEACGLPADALQVVTSRSRVFLDRFMADPAVRTVVFFGNSSAGASVSERCHALGKKCVLELEGSDHQLIWSDADLEGAVSSARHAFDFSTTPCPVPKHMLVHEAAFDAFLSGLLALVPACSVTIAADREHGNLVPVARPEAYFEALEQVKAVGTVHSGGFRMTVDGTPDAEGAYVAPTVVVLEAHQVLDQGLLCFEQEIFFPLIPVVRFSGSDAEIAHAMARIVQESPFGLRCSVWVEEAARVAWFTREIGDVGMLLFNEEHSRCPNYAAPWGGPRRSGGPHGENHLFWLKCSHLQAISCNRLNQAQRRAVFEGLGYAEFAETLGILRPVPRVYGDEDPVRLTIEGAVATVELNRPERHNAVNQAAQQALAAVVEQLSQTDGLRCVVIRGAGRSFCSGADLSMLQSLERTEARAFMMAATWSFRAFEKLAVPVIAQVHGYCMGGGFELALHCDEVVCSKDAVFALPETSIGLVTTAGSVSRLVAAVGKNRARELLMSGRRVSGAEAEVMGLATRSVRADRLNDEVRARVSRYCKHPPEGMAAMKSLLRSSDSWIAETEAFDGLIAGKEGA